MYTRDMLVESVYDIYRIILEVSIIYVVVC